MKKLLSMLAVSTLVGTSASNLKPLFTSNVSQGFKSNQLNKKISIHGENDTNPFSPKQLPIFNEQGIGALAVDENGNIYAGTETSLYKSTDGINFKKINITTDIDINDIVIKNETIYVSTNGSGLYKSTDGTNFIKINAINHINSLAIDENGNIYAGTKSSGLYKSTNGGETFSQVGNINGFITKIVFGNNGVIFVAVDGTGLYKSTDGINFKKIMTTPKNYIGALAVDENGNIYAGFSYDGLYKSTDGTNFIKINAINRGNITGILITKNQNFYVSTNGDGLYRSTNGGKSFTEIENSPKNIRFNSLVITPNDVIYFGTFIGSGGVWTINLINQLIKINKPDTFDKSWPLYKGIVYNSSQKIDIKDNLVASAILDNKLITIPTTDLDIPIGEHNLILTLKDKKLASVFGGDVSTGQVTYKLWIKTSIDKKDIKYWTNKDDTELYTGLFSNAGNTNGVDIIQTKNKNISVHQATLNSKFDDILIYYPNSYYEQGTVNEATNDFKTTGSKQKITKNLSIKNDGIYHLHLEDTVGNKYESYLELGESNWKLVGTFNDTQLKDLARKLNVTVNLTDTTQKEKALGWLHQYENFAENKFSETIKTNGKGFDSEIKNQITSYTSFLKSLTYDIANEPKFDDGLDKSELVTTITDKAKEILNKGLDALPKNLNVNTSNIVNKSTLDSYSIWIKGYDTFINNNKDTWINDITKIASRGFATKEQENQIKAQVSQFLDNSNIKNYLKSVVWEDNKLLKTASNDYQQYIELDKLQTDIINWVNQNLSAINTAYQNAIKNAESGLNLHGYSIDKILNGKQKPQTKNEIDKFADGQSYHDWLQSQANIKFRGWQLAMGFGIAIPLLLVVVAVGWIIRSRTNPKYNGVSRAKQDEKNEKKALARKIKEENKK